MSIEEEKLYQIRYGLVPDQDAPLRSHSQVFRKNHLFIVGIRPIRNKEL